MTGARESERAAREELQRLTNRMCDGTIVADELAELEQLLVNYPELRSLYLAYVRTHAELMWRYRTGSSAPHDHETPESPLADSPSSVGSQRTGASRLMGLPTWPSLPTRGVTLAAVVGIFLGAVGLVLLSKWFGYANGRVPLPKQPRFVATLRVASGPFWSRGVGALNVGARIRPGDVWLDTGEAELVFDSGAKLALAGPARMHLESSLSAFLESGKVVAHVPPSATGFRLRTPMATIIDQGTDFGVLAEADGASEVHVFRGQVDVHTTSNGREHEVRPLELVDGEARRIEKPGGVGRQVTYAKTRFGNLAFRVAEPIEWALEAGGNGHFYQLVVNDEPLTWHEAARRAMNTYYRGMPGHLVTMTSPAEDEFVVRNVVQELPPRGIWMGLTDVLREGHFRWITGEPVDYSNWANHPAQQPDNYREADWHGGEDYGMYTSFPDRQPWAWNDLSIDSIHEKVSAYLVEFEPSIDALRHRSMALEPIRWPKSAGGNGHYYQLVLSFEPTGWDVIRDRAGASSCNGTKGHLAAFETVEEKQFVVDQILCICGIPENMIGFSGARATDLKWVTGRSVGGIEIGPPYLSTNKLYGLLRWDVSLDGDAAWRMQARAWDVLPANWFGYLVEYPVGGTDASELKQ